MAQFGHDMLYYRAFVPKAPICTVNLRTVQSMRKEFGKSNGDYEGTAARKLTLLVLIIKELPNSWVRSRPSLTTIPQSQRRPYPGTQECLSFLSGRQCMKTFGIYHTRCARANRTLYQATQAGEPLHGCWTISVTTSPLKCGHLIP